MLIVDLPYCETLTPDATVRGAASALVIAEALAVGDTTYTLALTWTRSRPLPRGGSLAIGRGRAIAIGEDFSAQVIVAGEGDIVIDSTRSRFHPSQQGIIARGAVIAIDLPSRRG